MSDDLSQARQDREHSRERAVLAEHAAAEDRLLGERHAAPMPAARPTTDDSPTVAELVDSIESAPWIFAEQFLELRERVAKLERNELRASIDALDEWPARRVLAISAIAGQFYAGARAQGYGSETIAECVREATAVFDAADRSEEERLDAEDATADANMEGL